MSLFHRVMTIAYKYSTYLHFSNLRISHLTNPEMQALLLVEKIITKINFWHGPFRQGETINVRPYISKDFSVNFNFLAPNSAKNVD